MRFGLCAANIGSYADPRNVVRLAETAEATGWEALLLWDHLAWVWNGASADPWTALAAAGARTERLIVGTAVTPVPRRRPHVLANQLATLDELTGGGRVVLVVRDHPRPPCDLHRVARKNRGGPLSGSHPKPITSVCRAR